MKAIVLDQFGGPEVLQLRDMPLPEPGPGEVRIAVYAAGVNPVDAKVRQGALYNRPQGQVKHTMPLILGWDAAGIIDAVGSYTSHFSVGEAVFVRPDIRRNGAYAEYLVVEENLVAPMPSNLSFVEAASLPLVGLTAWQALLEAGGLQEGWKVFIHGGSGGVGSLAIQLAKAYGAWVSTNASRDNLDFVRSLGADEALDYASDEESAYHGSFDLVLDTRGAIFGLLQQFRLVLGNDDVGHGDRHAGACGPVETGGLEGVERGAHGDLLVALSKLIDDLAENLLVDHLIDVREVDREGVVEEGATERGLQQQAIAILQNRLSQEQEAALVLKHAHWNVTGPNFIAVHEMLDPEVEAVLAQADETAERIATLGGTPDGRADAIVRNRTWKSFDAEGRVGTEEYLKALIEYYDAFIADDRKAIAELDELDVISSNIIQDHVQELEKFQWFMRSHLA